MCRCRKPDCRCRPTRGLRTALTVLGLTLLTALGLTVGLPTEAQAVNTCNSTLAVDYTAGPNFGIVGDNYRVKLTLGTGSITGGTEMTIGAVNFSLDCTNTTTGNNPCTDETTKIKFVGNIGDVSAGCVDTNGAAVGVVTAHTTNSDSPNLVTFTFVDGSNSATSLVLPANTTLAQQCNFQFDVQIEALSGDGTPGLIEEQTNLAPGNASCDNGLGTSQVQSGSIPTCQVCDDTNACTSDVCNQTNNTCTFTPTGTCNDSNACTSDACNPATGQCTFTPTDFSNTCINPSFAPGGQGDVLDGCAILQLGGNQVSITGPSPGIDGDICVGPGGKLSESISSPGTIHGNVRLDQDATFNGRDSKVTGTVGSDDLSGEIQECKDIAAAAAANIPNGTCDQLFTSGLTGPVTISATKTGENIICVQGDVKGSGNDHSISFSGAGGNTFLVYITGKVALSGGADILVDGITPADLLLVVGKDVATSGGGGGANCCAAVIEGSVFAVNGKVALAPGQILGKICAGGSISLVSGSELVCQNVCIP